MPTIASPQPSAAVRWPFGMTARWRWAAACATVAAFAIALYAPSVRGRLVWDDLALVGGDAIGGGDSLLHCFTRPFFYNYYRPLVSVAFYVQRLAWGMDPYGYHVVSVLLHAIAAVLVAALARSITRSGRAGFVAGLVFAVHPALVGAVAWIGGLTDALATVALAACACGLVHSARARERWVGWAVAAWAAFAAGVFTKEQTLAILPLVPLTFACFAPEGARRRTGRGWAVTGAFLAVAVLYVAGAASIGVIHAGPGVPGALGLVRRVALTTWHYGLVLLAPGPRVLNTYSLRFAEQQGAWAVAAGIGLAVAWTVAAAWLLRRGRPTGWLLAMALLLLAPVSNLVPLPFLLVAPYRAALAVVPLAAVVGIAAASLPARALPAGVGALGLVLIWWSALDVTETRTWWTEGRLFTTIVRHDPGAVIGRYMLGRLRVQEGRPAEAAPQYRAALENLLGTRMWADGEAVAAAMRADTPARRRVLQNQGSRGDPLDFLTLLYVQLGFARLRSGNAPAAAQAFRAGEHLRPASPDLQIGLGACDYLAGRPVEAERRLRAALAVEPGRADAHRLLADVYARQGRWEEARRESAMAEDVAP